MTTTSPVLSDSNKRKIKQEDLKDDLMRSVNKRAKTVSHDSTENKENGSSRRAAKVQRHEEEEDDEEEDGEEDEDDDEEEEEGSSSSEEEDSDEESSGDDEPVEMSEDQRHKLQESYRLLDSHLLHQRAELTQDSGIEAVQTSLNKADELFSTARNTGSSSSSIIAKDSAILKEIGSQAVLATRNLKIGISERNLDFNKFTRMFKKKFSNENNVDNDVEYTEVDDFGGTRFNWLNAGLVFMRYSIRPATTDFLMGPLSIEGKQRSFTARAKDDSKVNGEATKASKKSVEQIGQKNGEDEDTTKGSERCFNLLRKKSGIAKVNLFEFFVDPDSFGKSVETLFYTSFLINNGKLILGYDDKIPYIQIAVPETYSELPKAKSRDDSKSHIILNMDFATWRGLVKKFNITRSYFDEST